MPMEEDHDRAARHLPVDRPVEAGQEDHYLGTIPLPTRKVELPTPDHTPTDSASS
jgi:hypothetical protein